MSSIDSILSKIHQGTNALVVRLRLVCGNARDERRNRKIWCDMERYSATWRDDYFDRSHFEVLRLRVPRQSGATALKLLEAKNTLLRPTIN